MEEKFKIEEELKFLKESFEASVISKEEYEEAKEKLEKKLSEIENVKREKEEKGKEEIKEKDVSKKIEIKEVTDYSEIEKKKESEKKEGSEEGMKKETTEDKKVIYEPKAEVYDTDKKEEKVKASDELSEKEKDANEILDYVNVVDENGGKKDRKFEFAVLAFLIIFIGIIAYFSFFTGNGDNGANPDELITEDFPECFIDKDCVKEGMSGKCENPGEEDSKCVFTEIPEVMLTVLNTDDCFNCDSGRVKKILSNWFKNLNIVDISYESSEGKEIAAELGIDMLPSFIFDSDVTENVYFNEYRSLFRSVEDNHVLSNTASGSTFYINRDVVPRKIDIFLSEGEKSTDIALRNIREFEDLFSDSINIEKHFITDDDGMVKELGINTFPTYLVNNKVLFTGVQPADVIKENFCEMNDLDFCDTELSKNLV